MYVLVPVLAVSVNVANLRLCAGTREDDLAANFPLNGVGASMVARAVKQLEELILGERSRVMVERRVALAARVDHVAADFVADLEVDTLRRNVHLYRV